MGADAYPTVRLHRTKVLIPSFRTFKFKTHRQHSDASVYRSWPMVLIDPITYSAPLLIDGTNKKPGHFTLKGNLQSLFSAFWWANMAV
jgi:hypothetical protein